MALVALSLCGARAWAQCAGDCDFDEVSSLAEVRTCVEVALLRQALGVCTRCDTVGGAGVTVDDLVRAVVDSLGPCSPLLSQTGQAGAASSLNSTLLSSAGILDIGYLASGGGGGGGSARLLGVDAAPALEALAAGGDGGGAELRECPLGGLMDVTCTRLDGGGVLEVEYFECGTIDEQQGVTLFYHGDQTIIAANPDFCLTGEIPFGTAAEVSAFDLSVNIGTLNGFVYANQRFIDTSILYEVDGPSCQFVGGVFSVNGEFVFSCFGGFGGVPAPCGLEAYSNHLGFTDFLLGIAPERTPGICSDRLAANGLVESLTDDFAAEFFDYVEVVTQTPNGTSVTQNGGIQVDCLTEPLILRTLDPVQTPPGAACPVGGRLEVRTDSIRDGVFVRYTAAGGVEIDLDGDGRPEQTFSSCEDPALQQCFQE